MIIPAAIDPRPEYFSIKLVIWATLLAISIVGIIIGFVLPKKLRQTRIILKSICFPTFIIALCFTIFGAVSRGAFEFNASAQRGLMIISVFIVFTIIAGTIVAYIATRKKDSIARLIAKSSIGFVFLTALALVLYFALPLEAFEYRHSGYWGGATYAFVRFTLIAFMGVSLIVALACTIIVLNKKFPIKFTTKDIAVAGVMLGLAIALSYIRFRLPQGGSITLASSLPIMIFCYFFGFRKGSIMVAAFLGFQFIQGIWIVNFWSLLLDYVVGYSALIAFGIFSYKRNIIKRADYDCNGNAIKRHILSKHLNFFIAFGIYFVIRYIAHVLSGVLFFYMYADTGFTGLTWALFYNLFFVADATIAVIGGVILLNSKAFNRFMTVSGNALQNADATHEDNQTTAPATDEREWQACGRDTTGNNCDIDDSLNGNDSRNSASEIATESIGCVLSDSNGTINHKDKTCK